MNVAIPEHASNHLRLISAISAVFVVFIHSTTLKHDAAFGWGSLTGQIQGLLSHNIFHVALPIFFLNAAFFLCHDLEKHGQIWPRLKRRGVTLAIPYLSWSGFWAGLAVCLDVLPELSARGLVNTWIVSPLPGQFWFLRDLIALMLFAPLVLLLPRSALAVLSLLAWMWWLWDQTTVTLDLRTHWYEVISNEALCWFLIGVLAARCAQPVLNWIDTRRSAYLLTVLLVIWLAGSKIPFPGQIAHGLSVSAGTLLLLGASRYMRWLAASRWTTLFAGYGFLIYAGHHPVIGLVQAWLLRGADGNQIWHLAVYLLTPLAIIVVIIGVFSTLFRLSPTIVFMANGGRPIPNIYPIPKKDLT